MGVAEDLVTNVTVNWSGRRDHRLDRFERVAFHPVVNVDERLASHPGGRALAAKGCMKVNLQIMEGNESVGAFYSALGFSVEKRVSMGKRLPENIPAA